jgi:RNA polymerase sigma factor (sigma-70 family)
MISELIIQGCIKEDRRCQRLLYEECYALMMKVAKRYFDNDDEAVDVMNRSFLKILQNLSTLKNDATFFGWAKQITVRTALDAIRAKKSYADTLKFSLDNEASAVHYQSTSSDETIESKINANEILKLIASLPNIMREVVNMVLLDGFSHKEVAETLGISENYSRQYLSRGRSILQQQIIEKKMYHNVIASSK